MRQKWTSFSSNWKCLLLIYSSRSEFFALGVRYHNSGRLTLSFFSGLTAQYGGLLRVDTMQKFYLLQRACQHDFLWASIIVSNLYHNQTYLPSIIPYIFGLSIFCLFNFFFVLFSVILNPPTQPSQASWLKQPVKPTDIRKREKDTRKKIHKNTQKINKQWRYLGRKRKYNNKKKRKRKLYLQNIFGGKEKRWKIFDINIHEIISLTIKKLINIQFS